ncbi:hypothetical protein EIP91_004198 [Steccherinum ochraceum]|uniref:Uncharacterized protein n=1 Tax=Steccherinum ochraceum TaxID=92696 RepID=A0A4V2MVZ9_9APHY|nr:hypothetical protein EIP91_004198 [Steccherinum ochraceum]
MAAVHSSHVQGIEDRDVSQPLSEQKTQEIKKWQADIVRPPPLARTATVPASFDLQKKDGHPHSPMSKSFAVATDSMFFPPTNPIIEIERPATSNPNLFWDVVAGRTKFGVNDVKEEFRDAWANADYDDSDPIVSSWVSYAWEHDVFGMGTW